MEDQKERRIYELVTKKIRLLTELTNEHAVSAQLAAMRKGAGKKPGDDPMLWGMLFLDLPPEMEGKNGIASREEWAIYTAMTLFALHQQGNDIKTSCMHQPKQSLGKAAAILGAQESVSEEAVLRRFNALATSQDIEELAWHLRGMVKLLASKGVKLDYARLAEDLYWYQAESQRSRVRLIWGQDYYGEKYNQSKEGEKK